MAESVDDLLDSLLSGRRLSIPPEGATYEEGANPRAAADRLRPRLSAKVRPHSSDEQSVESRMWRRVHAIQGTLDEDGGELARTDATFVRTQVFRELLELPPALAPEWHQALHVPLRVGWPPAGRFQASRHMRAKLQQIDRPSAGKPGNGDDSRCPESLPHSSRQFSVTLALGRTP